MNRLYNLPINQQAGEYVRARGERIAEAIQRRLSEYRAGEEGRDDEVKIQHSRPAGREADGCWRLDMIAVDEDAASAAPA